MSAVRQAVAITVGLAALGGLGGCPSGVEYIAGQTGGQITLGTPAVQVFSPLSDLVIAGGTPVEVSWRAVGSTRAARVEVFLDADTTPDNQNEIVQFRNLTLAQNTATIETSLLRMGAYFVGVRVREFGEIAASGYAAGRLIVNQRPRFFFTSPRDNVAYDRSPLINPSFNVAWTVDDPDSTVRVRIFLDPDATPNGNEILLRESNSQTGGQFTFDLPTASFEPGTYRILAQILDGVTTFNEYAPGTIRLRARLSYVVDLRNLHLPNGGVAGAVFEGFNPRDNMGSFVSSMSDLDGDGFSEFIMLAQFAKPLYQAGTQRTGIGEAYMVYGRPDRFSGVINANSTGTLFRGEIYGGVPEVTNPIRPSRGISSFTLLTDWDRDGVRDFAFGLPFTDSLAINAFAGFAAAPLDASGYFRSGGVVVVAGSSLRPDLGFPGRNVFNLAEFGTLAHVPASEVLCPEGFYGPKSPSPRGTSVTYFHEHLLDVGGTPNAGSVRLGCRFSSIDFGDQFGETISSWDFDALVISAPNRDPLVSTFRLTESVPGAGVVTVFYNNVKSGFYPWTNVQAPPANAAFNYGGTPGHGDGGERFLPHGGPYHYVLDHIRLVSAPGGFPLPGSPGYSVDSDDGEPCLIEESVHILTPGNSVRFWSNTRGARLGNVRGLGDLNADGLLDLAIGAPFVADGAGACYLVLGRLRDLVRSGELPVEELNLPMDASDPLRRRIFDGLRIVGAPGDRLGQSQDSAGDFNGDGLADVVIGSPLLNNRQGGVVVFFGTRDAINLTQEEIPYAEIPARGLGVLLIGEQAGDLAGARVVGAGDIDGDGFSDILIAAPNRSVRLDLDNDGVIDIDRTNCGVVYLVYGSATLRGTLSLSLIGTEQLPGAAFIGRRSAAFLGAGLGEQGDRSWGIAGAGDVDGDGAGDLLIGSVSASPRDRAAAGEVYLIYGAAD